MAQYGQTFTCCRCSESFKNSTDLIQHYEVHKLENLSERYLDQTATEIEETIELNYDRSETVISNAEGIAADGTLGIHYTNEDGTLINVDGSLATETLPTTSDLLYIIDEGQNITLSTQKTVAEDAIEKPVNNYTIIVDHGYMLPNSFEESTPKRKYKKKGNMFFLRTEAGASESSQDCDSILVQMEPSSSKDNLVYAMPKPRQSIILPRKRHELPDFTASEYQVIQPTEEIDIVHYKCIRCEQLFISKFVFYRHIEKGKCYVNSCDVCTATFHGNSEFYGHYLTDHSDRAICNFCFRTFMYEKNVKEHMLRHLDQFRHRCEDCNKGFYTVREYRNHYKNRHMGIRHKCDYCDRSFADEYYFKRHLAMHTITVPSRYSVYLRKWKRILTTWNIDDNYNFRKYQKKYNLKKAVVLLGDLDQFSPDKYPLVFTNARLGKLTINLEPEYGLEVSNIIASTRNKYKCDICLERYQTYIELKYHALIHEGNGGSDHGPDVEEPFPITKTILSAAQSETLPNMKIVNASDLECEVCGANFDNNLRYEAHVILHKKFSCTNCSARFSTSIELVNHAMQIHGIAYEGVVQQKASTESTKEKQSVNISEAEVFKYRCKVCNRRFVDCFQLQRHKRMHSKDLKNITEEKQTVKIGCDLCNQEFTSAEDMHEHRKEHLKPISILNDDDIIIVSVDDAAKPTNAVINLDSSDSDDDIVESDKSDSTVIISVSPTPQSPNTYTTAGDISKLVTITKFTSNQIAHPNEMPAPTILNKSFTPEPKLQCALCNFTSMSDIIMNEHRKIHDTYTAQPSRVTLTATINENFSQIANIVANTSDNAAVTTDCISTTTITTPPSINTMPSTSWGNQVVIISPSQASGQIIQHPIFIIPGNNSSNNTSNVDINIRTTNKTKTSPKTITKKKSTGVLTKGHPRKILPAVKSDTSSFIPISKKSTDSLSVKDNVGLHLQPNPTKFSIDVHWNKPEQAQNDTTINITEQQNYSIEPLEENTSTSDFAKPQNVDGLIRDTVIKSYGNQSEVFASGVVSQLSTQKPKISVKPLSVLMKSPVKGNIIEIEPEIGSFDTSPEQSVPNQSSVETEKEPTSGLVEVPKLTSPPSLELPVLTVISKAQYIESMSKKLIHINKKLKPPTAKRTIAKLIAPRKTTTASNSTPEVTDVVTKTTPTIDTETSQNKTKIASNRIGKKSESQESNPTSERVVHKCDSCSYEAKKRSKLHMHCRFKCNLCQFITCKLNNLDMHYESTHNILNICCPCDIRFPDSNSLLEHKNKVHVCPNCNKCQIDLTKHINGCKCPLCNFTTCKQSTLNTHYKATHNIVRNCAPCNLAFGSVTDFDDHKYSMHYCPKCKTYKMNLNVHKSFCKGDGVKILDRVESLKNLEVIEVD